MKYDLIIANGFVVSPSSTIKTDIGIINDKIIMLGDLAKEDTVRRVDATGKYVLPGVIEAHMHCMAPFQGCLGANNFFEQSISGAFGGVTMFMDFANVFKGKSVYQAVKERAEEMSMSAIDYSVHGKFVESDDETINEIDKLIEFGVPTFKLFMTYKKEGVMSADETLLKVFKKAKSVNGLPMLHCESNAIAEMNIEECAKNNTVGWKNFAESKPILCEAEAFSRAVLFAKTIKTPILVVHTTNKLALDIARKSHKEEFPIYVETCPHYLTLFEDEYMKKDGHLAICSPPLRSKKEAIDLWEGIKDGTITLTGSDDCTYSYKEKSMFLEKDENGEFIPDFRKVVNGTSGLEIRLPILLSEGVSKSRISINKVAEITSTNIAKVYGCYPRKGIIAPGSDADIVLVDMDKEVTLSKDVLHNNIDYCLHEGMKVKGYPIMTIARGKIIVENNEFKGEKGDGDFIKRKISSQYLEKYSLN